jgi:hypothetical protein
MVPVATLPIYVQPHVEQADRLRRKRDAALARIAELEPEIGRLEGCLEAREGRNWPAHPFGR